MNSQFCSSDKPLPYQLGSAAYSHFLHFELPVSSELWGEHWICFLFLPWHCNSDGSRKQLVSSSNASALPAWIFILTFTLDGFSAMIRFSDYNVSFHQRSLCDLTGGVWGFEQRGSSDMEVVLECWKVLPGSESSFLGSAIGFILWPRANFLTCLCSSVEYGNNPFRAVEMLLCLRSVWRFLAGC